MLNELTTNSLASPQAKSEFIRFSNKEVPFKFMGTSFSFSLSQSLFSSFNVDSGSQFLLRSVASQIDLKATHSILDIGCGVGVLGVCTAKKAAPHCRLQMEDRNALALLYSYQNALKNGLQQDQLSLRHHLMFEKDDYQQYDLILSNIPAKAGEPVIKHFLEAAPFYLSDNPKACVAVVIVKTLAPMAYTFLKSLQYEILFQERNPEYTVFHFRRTQATTNWTETHSPKDSIEIGQRPTLSLDNYIRQKSNFNLKDLHYSLDTVFNLPNFNEVHFTFGQQIELLQAVLEKIQKQTSTDNPFKAAIIHPEQGHAVQFLILLCQQAHIPLNLSLFSNDRLQLVISEHNFASATHSNFQLEQQAFFDKESMGAFDFVFFNPNNATLPHEIEFYAQQLANLVRPEGHLLFSAQSTHSNFYQKALSQFSLVRAKKTRGYRSLLLRRK